MVRSARDYLEAMDVAMIAAPAGRAVAHDSIFPINPWSGLVVATFPPPDPDHLVVLFPVWKRVVCRMNRDEATTVANKRDQRGVRRLRPRLAVVIRYDYRVVRKLRRERSHVAALRWRGSHVHHEKTGLFEELFEMRRARFPVVVVLSVEDQ